MANSLINTAMSGLNAAQAAFNVTANNISNQPVAGYNRETAIISQSNGSASPQGYFGNGVKVTGVNREYNEFVVNQLRSADSINSALTTYSTQMTQVDNLMSSTSSSVAATMQKFFSNLQVMTSNADDDTARQTVLGSANAMVNQFKSTDAYLYNLDRGVNTQLTDNVKVINNYTKQIADLNQQITYARGSAGGTEPNALLDQRDQLVNQLNQVIGVNVSVQDGTTFNVSLDGGLSLVQGDTSYNLAAMPSSADPSRTTIGYTTASGTTELPESMLTKGTIGGLLTFRSQSLDPARNQLGQIALTLADQFNTVHTQGYDLEGHPGQKFFDFPPPSVITNSRNTGTTGTGGHVVTVAYQPTDPLDPTNTGSSQIQASDYNFTYDGASTSWKITRVSDGANITATTLSNGHLGFDGLDVDVSAAAPASRDSFTIKTVSSVATNLNVAIHDSASIAAASSAAAGEGDNRNAQKLLNLQSANLVQGKSTLNGAYASLVSNVGVQAKTISVNSATQSNIVKQLTATQQSISGVNQDEEYGNLQRFQQYYLANAQVMKTASTIFDSLLQATQH